MFNLKMPLYKKTPMSFHFNAWLCWTGGLKPTKLLLHSKWYLFPWIPIEVSSLPGVLFSSKNLHQTKELACTLHYLQILNCIRIGITLHTVSPMHSWKKFTDLYSPLHWYSSALQITAHDMLMSGYNHKIIGVEEIESLNSSKWWIATGHLHHEIHLNIFPENTGNHPLRINRIITSDCKCTHLGPHNAISNKLAIPQRTETLLDGKWQNSFPWQIW